MELKNELSNIIRGEVNDSSEILTEYSRDASIFSVRPAIIVFPKNIDDIKTLVNFASKHQEDKISLTARAAGTDMTGGPLNESIIVDVTKYLNNIKAIDNHYAIVQPGLYYRDFETQTLKKNLLLPSFPASKSICAVGGMVANNSGGEKTLAYGKTDRYVKQLKVILSDSNEYIIKPLNKIELTKKIEENTYESNLYKRTFELINSNYELIKKAKPNVSKNSSGYALWDVWDGETFDLTKLFTGSQGTLGIITEITFRLITPKKHSRLLVCFIPKDNKKDFAKIINAILPYKPESLEYYDHHTFTLALKYLSRFMGTLNINIFSLLFQFIPEFWMLISGGIPQFVLLAEFTGDTDDETFKKCREAKVSLHEMKLKTRITSGNTENEKYLAIRRESFNLLRQRLDHKITAPFIEDIIVQPEVFQKFIPELESILEQYDITYTVAGHAGNGNIHIIPLIDMHAPETPEIIKELMDKVYNLVISYGGSITAEHNDGIIRTPYLTKMFGEEIYGLFIKIKEIFDPLNIFNPGKKVGSDWDYAKKHMIKEN